MRKLREGERLLNEDKDITVTEAPDSGPLNGVPATGQRVSRLAAARASSPLPCFVGFGPALRLPCKERRRIPASARRKAELVRLVSNEVGVRNETPLTVGGADVEVDGAVVGIRPVVNRLVERCVVPDHFSSRPAASQ